MMYRIYRNIRRGDWSIQHKVDGRWLKMASADHVIATDCVFKVSQAGRDRVRREGRKNVHAFIVAQRIRTFDHLARTTADELEARLTYNPYDTVPGFHRKFYYPDVILTNAGEVELTSDGHIYGWMLNNNLCKTGVATRSLLW